jgi:hypothetical protein
MIFRCFIIGAGSQRQKQEQPQSLPENAQKKREILEMEKKNQFAKDVVYTWLQSKSQNRSDAENVPVLSWPPARFPGLRHAGQLKKEKKGRAEEFEQG